MYKSIIGFVVGAAAGGAASYFICKNKFTNNNQEELDEMRKYYKEYYKEKYGVSDKEENKEPDIPEKKEETETKKGDLRMASKYNKAFTNDIPQGNETPVIRPITVDEWEEAEDYSREYGVVFYEEDGVLEDALGNRMIIDDTVGEASLEDSAFDDDVSYAVNDSIGVMYEIQRIHNASYNKTEDWSDED